MALMTMSLIGCSQEPVKEKTQPAAGEGMTISNPVQAPAGKPDLGGSSGTSFTLADYRSFSVTEKQVSGETSQVFKDCLDSAVTTTGAYASCYYAEYEDQTSALEEALSEAIERLPDAASKNALRRDQAAWLKNREVYCEKKVEPFLEGGSIDIITRQDCALTEIVRRTLWLWEQAKRAGEGPAQSRG
ncbi:DUF1311 domain-containing protein [Allosphingosinicella flava]|uniref:DUF1311 domain-containing protein n=1 Tax=Allosphingosinicella flava TaxID=2771430 RepID=A0A7T2LLI5_9SPHN|nr:lysozyme inhibitor LprI family protein [Sphingosinicella flava]QPQ54474.1 DUF1311 domain-containing protein [Sphingosinicella flava]